MPFITALRERWLTAALLARLWPAPKSAAGTVNGATPPMVTIANVLVRISATKLAQLGYNILTIGPIPPPSLQRIEQVLYRWLE